MTQLATLIRAGLVLPSLLCLALGSACGGGSQPSTGGSGAGAPSSAGSGSGVAAGGNGSSPAGAGNGSSGSSNGAGSSSAGSDGTAGSSNATGGTGTGSGGSGSGSAGGPSIVYPTPGSLTDETGADLWLRYPRVVLPVRLAEYQAALTHVVSSGSGATTQAATEELVKGLSGLTGNTVTLSDTVQGPGAVVIGTPAKSTLIAGLPLASELSALGSDGYIVRSAKLQDQTVLAVAASTELGVLY
ncbi:MAG TPA: alpha-glucuronidase family glycosyl hydrolase, partial [Polyangiaceae bacterium]|nr:alpha-glucuronidase family glycosyl hydrolase [Polyangiaceae bacterium]